MTPDIAAPAPPDAALRAARDDVVFCDLAPLAILAVGGADAEPFLNGQVSIDVRELSTGVCRYASFNSPKGRMLANFVLWRHGDSGGYRALLPAEICDAVRKRLAMFVLRAKVTLSDVSADHVRVGVGGPRAAEALRATLGVAPAPREVLPAGDATVLGLTGARFIVIVPAHDGPALRKALRDHATEGAFPVWQWLTIRAGVPVVTAATQDAFVAQTANWDVLGGIDFRKGCYTGQEIIARTQYLGRLKERAFMFHSDRLDVAAGTRTYNALFGNQPCGTVVNAASAPDGGSDLLAVLQLAAAEVGDTRLGDPAGPLLVPLPLPYVVPPPAVPRGRLA
jgi:folate-binding protein YgfZ